MNIHYWPEGIAPPALLPNDVHIWRASLLASSAVIESVKKILSSEELRRGQRFVTAELRNRFWLAHAWKRVILARYVNQLPQQLAFTSGEFGKPYLSSNDKRKVQFNISHSGDSLAIAVMQDAEVGMDIELMNEQIEALALAQRFFAAEECQLLLQLPPAQLIPAFYRIWTLKEAVIKAIGQGLHYALSAFAVQLADDFTHCLTCLPGYTIDSWSVFALPVLDNYAAAVASDQPIKNCYCLQASQQLK